MKTLSSLFVLLALLAACESKAGTGALVGGAIGMGAGALISPTAGGVLIGGAVGATTGAIVGASLDNDDRKSIRNESPKTMKRIDRGEQLSINDIKKMSAAGISDDKIIGTIQATHSTYELTADEVTDLENAGVSKRVIDYMMRTAYH